MMSSVNLASIQFWSLPLGPEVLSRKEMIEQIIFNKVNGPYMTFVSLEEFLKGHNKSITQQKIILNNLRSYQKRLTLSVEINKLYNKYCKDYEKREKRIEKFDVIKNKNYQLLVEIINQYKDILGECKIPEIECTNPYIEYLEPMKDIQTWLNSEKISIQDQIDSYEKSIKYVTEDKNTKLAQYNELKRLLI